MRDPNAYIPVADFVKYVQAVEAAYPSDASHETVTRIRVQYYSVKGISGIKFDQLIPGAKSADSYVNWATGGVAVIPRDLDQLRSKNKTAWDHLTAKADENGDRDNPSPYILLDSEEIDVGHALLGLDALNHPTTSFPYTTYGIPNIDVSSWVADLGIAAVWTQHHEDNGAPDGELVDKLSSSSYTRYWQMSAPDADLLGDADSFGLFDAWSATTKLSDQLSAYYLSPRNVKRRWQIFCAQNAWAFTSSGGPASRAAIVTRVDRFNDLYSAGTAGSVWQVLTPGDPPRKSWRYTGRVVDDFLAYVKVRFDAELAGTPVPGPIKVSKKVYLFKFSNYMRYDIAGDRVDRGPLSIDGNWPGLPPFLKSGIDAALDYPDGYIYMFRGNQYAGYNVAKDVFDHGPYFIRDKWKNLPSHFRNFESAVNWGNGFCFFTRGDEYVTYEVGKGATGGAKFIRDDWHGLPASFQDGFNAMVNYGNGYVYIMKDDTYVAYSIADDKVDGVAKTIVADWHGVVPPFTSDLDAMTIIR